MKNRLTIFNTALIIVCLLAILFVYSEQQKLHDENSWNAQLRFNDDVANFMVKQSEINNMFSKISNSDTKIFTMLQKQLKNTKAK